MRDNKEKMDDFVAAAKEVGLNILDAQEQVGSDGNACVNISMKGVTRTDAPDKKVMQLRFRYGANHACIACNMTAARLVNMSTTGTPAWYVECRTPGCGLQTAQYATEAEAVDDWNQVEPTGGCTPCVRCKSQNIGHEYDNGGTDRTNALTRIRCRQCGTATPLYTDAQVAIDKWNGWGEKEVCGP